MKNENGDNNASSAFKRFSHEVNEDGKELRKFKRWCMARMTTSKDLPKDKWGAWIYTLLDGKALVLNPPNHDQLRWAVRHGRAGYNHAWKSRPYRIETAESQLRPHCFQCSVCVFARLFIVF